MRKFIFITILIFPLIVHSQVKLGFRAGMNLSDFIYRPQYRGDSKGSSPYLPRFNGGVVIEIPLNDDDNWFLYTGPYYSGKGSGSGHKLFSTKRDTIRTYLNYIELPLSVEYKFSEGYKNRLIAGAGIYGAYGFNGKVLYRNDPVHTERNLHKKDNRYKRIDAGFSINAMYEIKSKWGVRLDYSRSIFDISRYQWKETNSVFGFSFFWYLKNKKEAKE